MKSTIISIPESLGASVLGFAIVFVVLIVLMYVIKAIRAATEMAAVEAPASAAAAPAAKANANMIPAKGSLGDIRLFDVDDKTAAMLMAIVADKMDAPLNTLRFLSIREKKG